MTVSVSSALPAGNIIESASSLFANNPSNTSTHADSARHQRAMARRLEQLNAALGEYEAQPSANRAKVLPLTPGSAVQPQSTTGIGSLLVTGLLSALLGAAAMWLAMQPETHIPSAPAPLIAAASPAPAILAPTPVAAPVGDKAQVAASLENWRNAWMQRDIASYLNAYSQQFAPADGSLRSAWVATRTKKLSAGAPIDIQVRELAIEQLDADHFQATFLQDYASGSYREMARTKTLLIARENGEWKITKEWMAEIKPATR